MSKLTETLEVLISEVEHKTVDRDTTVKARHWAQNVLNLDNQLQMLRSDIRVEGLEADDLPLTLATGVRAILDKAAKSTFPASMELSALVDRLQTFLTIREDLDESDDLWQRAQTAVNAYKAGQPASETRNRPNRPETDKGPDMRSLDGWFKCTQTRADGSSETKSRNGDYVGIRYGCKQMVDKAANVGNVDEKALWAPIGTLFTNWAHEVISANSDKTEWNRTFQDELGNQYELTFTPQT